MFARSTTFHHQTFMRIFFVVALFFSAAEYAYGQRSNPDTLKGKRAWSCTMGNTVKGGLGTTFIAVGYHPNRHIDFYIAPSYGIFTGGVAIFCGSKLNFFSKRRLFVNTDLAYRRSSRTIVNYENHDSGGQESYYIPPSDYLLAGIGLNYKRLDPQNENGIMVFNTTVTYNTVLGDHHFSYRKGPFSKDGEDGAARKLAGGWGFTLSFSVQIWRDKKKKTG